MQVLVTLIASTVCILDRLEFKGMSSSMTFKLQNLRKLLDEISKFTLFGQNCLQDSLVCENNQNEFCTSSVESQLQMLIKSLPSKNEHISINSSRKPVINGDIRQDACSLALNGAYQSLLVKIKDNWDWIHRKTLKDVLERDDNQEEENSERIQEMQDVLNQFRKKLKYYMNDQKRKEISQDPELEKQTSGGRANGDSMSHSSVRSLLTEKLKHLAPSSHNDDEISCLGGKIILKHSWIMKEMRDHSIGNVTEPPQIQTRSGASLGENPQSVGVFSTIEPKNASKVRFQAHRPILKELNFLDPKPRERKQKKQKTGCAQCDIY